MRHNEERAIADLRQALAGAYLLRYSLAALTLWAFAYGTAVLALRNVAGLSRLDLLWGLASLPLALIPAVFLALPRLPARERIRAILDHHGRCGGLLMAGAEHRLDDWRDEMPAHVPQPQVSWRGGRSLGLFAAALAFVALGFLAPQSIASLGSSRLDVTREVERLKDQLEVLKKEKIVEAEKAEALKVKLDELRRESSGKDPVKTIDALDHVADQVKKAAEEAAEKTQRKMEEMSRAEALADALRNGGDKLTPEQSKEAMNLLASLLRKAAEENELLEESLDAETLEAIKKNKLTAEKLTPELLKKIADALKDGNKGAEMKIAKLVRAKLIDADALKKCDKAGKCDSGELAAYLKENGLGGETADALLENGGKGGVERGPGAAKLTFGEESNEEGVKFKEQELPPSEQQNLKDSQLSGISQGAPNIGKEKAVRGGSGALDRTKTGGGSASTQTILPRHKGAVQRYFERPMRPKK